MGLIHELSSEGWKSFSETLFERLIKEPNSVDSWMFSTGVKVAKVDAKYIQGTMCVTIKRDFMGVPLFFVGNFLPHI